MSATGWIIAAGIILFIIVLLAIPVVIRFEYAQTLKLRVRYLFFTLYRIPEKPKKRGRTNKQKPKKGKAAEKDAADAPPVAAAEKAAPETADSAPKTDKTSDKTKKEKNPKIPTLSEIFELIKVFVDSLGKPLKKLLKRIHINCLDLRMVCGGEDAAKAALKFGAVNLAVGNALGHLGSWFTLKDPHIDINVDFQSEQTLTECSCTVKTSALTALAFVFSFVFRLLLRALRNSAVMGYLKRVRK